METFLAASQKTNKLKIRSHVVSEGKMKRPGGFYTIGGTNMKCG